MDIISAYREVGTYRGAAVACGTTHKTVRRVIARHEGGGARLERVARGHNYDGVAGLVAARVTATAGRISAKRLLPAARAAGYAGSGRNFRRLVAAAKQACAGGRPRGPRPPGGAAGGHPERTGGPRRGGVGRRGGGGGVGGGAGPSGGWGLRPSRRGGPSVGVAAARRCGRRVSTWIDWGAESGLHVFCAVLAWSRFRFVRFAADERAETTLGLLAECFEVLGGVPGTVLADRMGCLKGAVVANVVVPTAEYVRFAAHYGFRPAFC